MPIARAPLPVPKSAQTPLFKSSFFDTASETKSTISSVSGLGIKTPSWTLKTKSFQCSHPTTYWKGFLSSILCLHKQYNSSISALILTLSLPSPISEKSECLSSTTSSINHLSSLHKISESGPLSDCTKVDPIEEATDFAQLCHFLRSLNFVE